MSLAKTSARLTLLVMLCGCASIAGFEDFSRGCRPDQPSCTDDGGTEASGVSGSAGANGSAGSSGSGGNAGDAGMAGSAGALGAGSGGGAGTGSCDRVEPPGIPNHGPTMAKIRRPDASCFWIDTTEVTVAQFADYLAYRPTPIDDALCSGPPIPNSQCETPAAGDGAASDGKLPVTCVDWCAARDFCTWAGKALCRDDLGAIGHDQRLLKSDYYAACATQMPFGEDCGALVCNVDDGGPRPAAGSNGCFTLAADGTTQVYDLIGNVEEWTGGCESDVVQGADCAIRGASFLSGRMHQCCAQLTTLQRRRKLLTLGFRCCHE